MKDEANIRVDVGTSGQITTNVEPKSKLEVIIGDAAKMDCQKAINYIKSGAAEIEQAVQEGIEDFNENAVSKTGDFNTNAVNKTNAFNQNAVNKTQDFDDNAATKQAAVDASAAEAKQWAIGDPTEPDGYSSKYWAGQAHAELSDLQNDVAAIQDVIPSEASETNKLTDKDYVDTALALKANASNTVTTNTAQTITSSKTFTAEQKFKSSSNTTTNGLSIAPYTAGGADIGLRDTSNNWLCRLYFNYNGTLQLTGTSVTSTTPTQDTTSSTQIDTVGARNTKLANYVTTNTAQTISESKTFSKEIFATLASYSATNAASNANPYKKIGECILTGTYQTVNVPFIYSRTNHSASSDAYLGKIVLRTGGTEGTLDQSNTGVIISEVPDFIDTGDLGLYVVYKSNTPETNKVTCQIWVYVKNTYQGVNIMPLRQGTGSSSYSTTNITWGNNLVEASELPSDYTAIIQKKAVIYNVTQSTTDNSRKVATTAYVKNNLVNYVTTNTAQTISGDKDFTGTVTAVTQTAGDNSTKVATTAYVDSAVSGGISVPTGVILAFGGSTAPTGFLLCDGSAVSRTDYADLFDVIGTTYGSGDGSTTFNVPNLSTAVLPSTSTVDVMGNGNALAIVDDLSTEAKQHNALVVGSGSSSFTTAKVPFAEFSLANPLAVGDLASNANEFGTVKKALGVSTLPEWSGLTGSITGVSVNYIIKV